MASEQNLAQELMELVALYVERFGHGPPASLEVSIEEEIALLKQALETGVPVPGWESGNEFSLKGDLKTSSTATAARVEEAEPEAPQEESPDGALSIEDHLDRSINRGEFDPS